MTLLHLRTSCACLGILFKSPQFGRPLIILKRVFSGFGTARIIPAELLDTELGCTSLATDGPFPYPDRTPNIASHSGSRGTHASGIDPGRTACQVGEILRNRFHSVR